MRYFFAFGNHPDLSRAELNAVLERHQAVFSVVAETGALYIVETKEQLPATILTELGGTIKYGVIKKTRHPHKLDPNDFMELLPGKDAPKCYFGLSIYGKDDFKLLRTGLTIKKNLKTKIDGKIRFVVGKDNPLSSVIVQKNELLTEHGREMVAIFTPDIVYLGTTLAVQDFERYGLLDFGRPERDDKSGMLPPKVAQMMLNLSGKTPDKSVILDPFCGSGTIVNTAALLGFKTIIGMDKSDKAVTDTEKNLAWLKEHAKTASEFVLQNNDVLHLSSMVKDNTIDTIVTEPFLGPPLKGSESDLQLHTTINELTSLYKKALAEFAKVLKLTGTVVMIIPEFHIKDHIHEINPAAIVPPQLRVIDAYKYSRPNQRVVRNICVMQKIS